MLKTIGAWVKKRISPSVTFDDVIAEFKEKKVGEVILEPACYWRPSVRHLFRHKCVINYVGVRREIKPIRRQEVLLLIKGRSTDTHLREQLADLSPLVYERMEEILEKVPRVHVGIAHEYLKMLGGNLYVLPLKNSGTH